MNVNWFLFLEDAKEKINAFKEDYSHFRPHSALGNMTPIEALTGTKKARNLYFRLVSFWGVAQKIIFHIGDMSYLGGDQSYKKREIGLMRPLKFLSRILSISPKIICVSTATYDVS